MVYRSIQDEGMTGFAIRVFKRPFSRITFGLLEDSGYDLSVHIIITETNHLCCLWRTHIRAMDCGVLPFAVAIG